MQRRVAISVDRLDLGAEGNETHDSGEIVAYTRAVQSRAVIGVSMLDELWTPFVRHFEQLKQQFEVSETLPLACLLTSRENGSCKNVGALFFGSKAFLSSESSTSSALKRRLNKLHTKEERRTLASFSVFQYSRCSSWSMRLSPQEIQRTQLLASAVRI